MKNKQMFVKYMTLLAEIHNKDISTTLLEVYWTTFQKYSDDSCEAAFNHMILNLKFFPKPVDFIEAINSVSNNQPQSSPDKAAVQVSEILQQVRNVGSWGTPVYSDPITKRLMTSRWLWPSVCAMTEDEHKWWAKEFSEAYQATEKLDPHPAIECGENPRLKLLAGGIGR